MRWFALATLLAVLAAALAARLYQSGDLRFNYPSRSRFPVQGIDVSHHQGAIDWQTLRSEQLDFALIKATEGSDHSDRHFAENWSGAGEAGLLRGAYHFFTFCTPGADQARHFLATVSPLPRELPPIADVEFDGNCRGWTSIEAIRSELADFLRLVGEALGQTPILYVTAPSHRRIVEGVLDRYPLWVRNVFFEPSPRQYPSWSFWQYADNARLSGIQGPVDLNAFCCSREELEALAGTRPSREQRDSPAP